MCPCTAKLTNQCGEWCFYYNLRLKEAQRDIIVITTSNTTEVK